MLRRTPIYTIYAHVVYHSLVEKSFDPPTFVPDEFGARIEIIRIYKSIIQVR